MATIGAAYIHFAAFTTTSPDESSSSYPRYQAKAQIGGLVKATDTPTFAEASLDADNVRKEYVRQFTNGTLSLELSEINRSVAATIFGATLSTTPADLTFKTSDTQPYGGIAFYSTMMKNGVRYYQGHYFPKCKAKVPSGEFSTMGQSITFATSKLDFEYFASANDTYHVTSDEFTTEAEAVTWVSTMLPTYTPST